ncbi:MAG: NusG domain II-containing protein [Rhodothermales bacterium]
MHRRTLIKMMSLAGIGSLATGVSLWGNKEEAFSYVLITAQPIEDAATLTRLAGLNTTDALDISTRPIQAAAQDLSILYHGHLLDPTRAGDVPPRVADFAHALRSRPQPGHVLLTVEPKRRHRDDEVTFEQNGKLYERVSLRRNYRSIEMPGTMGTTVFRLQDSHLSVVASSCRHQLCKKMNARAAGKIICAPNKLVATLPGRAGLVDALTG